MTGSLRSLGDGAVVAIFASALVATFGWFALLPSLRPNIIRLELAPTTTSAQGILDAWESRGQLDDARRSVQLDLGLIVLYTFALVAAAVLIDRYAEAHEVASAFTGALVYVALAAGALDYLENVGLWLLLGGHTVQPVPALTTLISGLKWLAIAVVVVAAVVVGFQRLLAVTAPG